MGNTYKPCSVFARGEIVTAVFSNNDCFEFSHLNVFEPTALTIQILLRYNTQTDIIQYQL